MMYIQRMLLIHCGPTTGPYIIYNHTTTETSTPVPGYAYYANQLTTASVGPARGSCRRAGTGHDPARLMPVFGLWGRGPPANQVSF